MSQTTFKNARPQRLYRERAQPHKRQHFGLLEKHKDFKQRAINFHQKQDKLKRLQLKAALRNKEEFNFKMVKGQLKDGKHVEQDSSDDDDNFDPKEYQRIVKTQNQNLLAVQYHINEKKVNNLQETLQQITGPKQNSHKFFVPTDDDVRHFDTSKLDYLAVVPRPEELRSQYDKLEKAKAKRDKMRGYYLKLDFEKKLLTNEKKKIQKHKQGKTYKFMVERKR